MAGVASPIEGRETEPRRGNPPDRGEQTEQRQNDHTVHGVHADRFLQGDAPQEQDRDAEECGDQSRHTLGFGDDAEADTLENQEDAYGNCDFGHIHLAPSR